MEKPSWMWRRIKKGPWHFPSGPVVKTPHFHLQKTQVQSLVGQRRSTCCAMWQEKKKQTNKEEEAGDLYGRKVLTFFTGKTAESIKWELRM